MSNTYVNGKVYVRKSRCDTCIFRPGNLMHLEDGRAEKMAKDADAENGAIPCHKHLYEGNSIEPVCRGYFDRAQNQTLRLAEAIGIVEFMEDE